MQTIHIQHLTISESSSPLVVPEIGINHSGNSELTKSQKVIR